MGPLWLVPALPLAAFAACVLLPRRATRAAGIISALGMIAALILMISHFAASLSGQVHKSILLTFNLAGRQAVLGLATDPLSAIMGLLVAFVAAVVITYGIGYMHGEDGQRRFFAEMSLFAASMLVLVLAADYLLLYVGWEIVGACSYLLIGHYWSEGRARRGSLKAFLVTRTGDVGLLLGIALMFVTAGGTNYGQVFVALNAGTIPGSALHAIPFMLLAGAVGKSAQFPLQLWLPDAMAGPTPVSALIHSATMVAAGIYLVARSFPLFEAVPSALAVLTTLAPLSAIASALAASAQMDIKRLLAYSTISQLGEMGIALGIGAPMPAIFHLITQASFKALLFLAAGIVTKHVGGNDLSKLHTNSTGARLGFLVGALSLSGIPPFAGFWSKDAIAHAAGPGMQIVLALLSFLGAFYIARAYLLGFSRRVKRERGVLHSVMGLSVWLLAIATLTVGFIQSPAGSGWLGRYLLLPASTRLDVTSAIHPALAALGWLGALAIYRWRVLDPEAPTARWASARNFFRGGLGTDSEGLALARLGVAFGKLASFIDRKTFDRISDSAASLGLAFADIGSMVDQRVFDRLSDKAAVTVLRLASANDQVDHSVLDQGVERGAESLSIFSERARLLQTGRVYHYLAAAFAWVLALAIITLAVRT